MVAGKWNERLKEDYKSDSEDDEDEDDIWPMES